MRFLARRRSAASPGRRSPRRTAELNQDRHGLSGAGRHGEAGLDVHRDLRIGAIVDVADERFGDRRNAAAFAFGGIRHFPSDFRHVRRNPAVDFAFEISRISARRFGHWSARVTFVPSFIVSTSGIVSL